jgi:hypothetical protein
VNDDIPATAVLHIPKLHDWYTLNSNSVKTHWSVGHRLKENWREITRIQCHRQRMPKHLEPSIVQLTYIFNMVRNRDPHNFICAKPIIDELVTWGCWPDDNQHWVTVPEPILIVNDLSPQGIIVRCYPREVSS